METCIGLKSPFQEKPAGSAVNGRLVSTNQRCSSTLRSESLTALSRSDYAPYSETTRLTFFDPPQPDHTHGGKGEHILVGRRT